VTAADLARSIAAGLAIAAAIIGVVFILRPQSPSPIFVPATFSPAPVPAPHCTAPATSPAGLHGLPDCKGTTP